MLDLETEWAAWLPIGSILAFLAGYVYLERRRNDWGRYANSLRMCAPWVAVILSSVLLVYEGVEALVSIPTDIGGQPLVGEAVERAVYVPELQAVVYIANLVLSFFAYFLFSEALLGNTLRRDRDHPNPGGSLAYSIAAMAIGLAVSVLPLTVGGTFSVMFKAIRLEGVILLYCVALMALVLARLLMHVSHLAKTNKFTVDTTISGCVLLALPCLEPMLGNAFQVLAIGLLVYHWKTRKTRSFDLDDLAHIRDGPTRLAGLYLLSFLVVGIALSTALPLIDSNTSAVLRNESLTVAGLTVPVFFALITFNANQRRWAWFGLWCTVASDMLIKSVVLSVPLSFWLNEGAAEAMLQRAGVSPVMLVVALTAVQLLLMSVPLLVAGDTDETIKERVANGDVRRIVRHRACKVLMFDLAVYIGVITIFVFVTLHAFEHAAQFLDRRAEQSQETNKVIREVLSDEYSAPLEEKMKVAKLYAEGSPEAMLSFVEDARMTGRAVVAINCGGALSLFLWMVSVNGRQFRITRFIRGYRPNIDRRSYRYLVLQCSLKRREVCRLLGGVYWIHAASGAIAIAFILGWHVSLALSYESAIDKWERSIMEERAEIANNALMRLE